MKERLIIKNFGPIKSVDLELGKITVLIGEQATGKSTIAKVLSICRYFSYIVDESELITNYTSRFSNTALLDWGLMGFERKDSFISYSSKDYKVEIEHHKSFDYDYSNPNEEPVKIPAPPLFKPTLKPISDRFKKLFQDYQDIKPKPKTNFAIQEDWTIPYSFLTSDVKNVMNNPFYFPTERGLQSIFSIGKRGLENLNDRLYEQLAALNGLSTSFNKETEIKPLGLYYKYEGGQAKFKGDKDKEYFNLSQGASGYQSTIPIVLAVKYYNEVEKRKRTFIVEEPEQNLFPKTQKKLIEFLVEYVGKIENQFILPTHSPYILTTLSNLIYAHKVGTAENGKCEKDVDKIISKKSWIDVNDISVYYLKEGCATNMVNVEECIINLDDLDSVSEIINNDFDELLSLELKNNLNG